MSPCCDDPECFRGTPKPGKDTCSAFSHGHIFLDGMCTQCFQYGPPYRERYDHVDACAFWRKQRCDCTMDPIGICYVECPDCKGRKRHREDKCLCESSL